ncbi:MAG TPA: hypothetical protein VL997_13210, partial [Dyella sp.]|nr:hypothetical protein [Dyella sp.]
MIDITRRTFIISSIGLVGSSLLPRFVWASNGNAMAAKQRLMLPQNKTAMAPREQSLFDFGWRFAFGNGDDPTKDFGYGFGQSDFSKTGTFKIATADFNDAGWRHLNLPHDWAVEL